MPTDLDVVREPATASGVGGTCRSIARAHKRFASHTFHGSHVPRVQPRDGPPSAHVRGTDLRPRGAVPSGSWKGVGVQCPSGRRTSGGRLRAVVPRTRGSIRNPVPSALVPPGG